MNRAANSTEYRGNDVYRAITIKCPQCGASGEPAEGQPVYACRYCGSYNVWNPVARQYSLKAATRDEARIKLGQLRLDFNESTFLSAIENLDDDGIGLFLIAGAERWGPAGILKGIEKKNIELVRALLSKGARVSPATALFSCLQSDLPDDLITAFGPFAEDESTVALEKLVHTDNVFGVSRLFKLASPNPNLPIQARDHIQHWFKEGDPQSLLIKALHKGNLAMSKVLIDNGAGLMGDRGGFRQGFARAEAFYVITISVRRNDAELVKKILQLGFESDEWINVALREAANDNALESIRVLRERGASIGAEGARQAADAAANDQYERLNGFLAAGLDPNQIVVVKGGNAASIHSGSISNRDRAISLLRITILRSATRCRRALQHAGAQSQAADFFDMLPPLGCVGWLLALTLIFSALMVKSVVWTSVLGLIIGVFLAAEAGRSHFRSRNLAFLVSLNERPKA